MIRLAKLTDYGFVVLTHFANNTDRRIHNARDVAEEVGLPLPTVSKLLKTFARGGLLSAHRGVNGGYSLNGKPDEIKVSRILEVLEGPIAITECMEGGETSCVLQIVCPVRPKWQGINVAVKEALQKISLADMAKSSSQFVPLVTGSGGQDDESPKRRRQRKADVTVEVAPPLPAVHPCPQSPEVSS
jgi:FeS assembly SUF system regulator